MKIRYRKTLAIVAVTLVGLGLSQSHRPAVSGLGLFSSMAAIPSRPYTLVTYALPHPDFLTWAYNSFALICSGLLVEREFTNSEYWGLVLGTVPVVGIGFVVFVSHPAVLVGSEGVAWVLGGAALAFGFIRWRQLGWLARFYVLWLALSFLLTPVRLLDPNDVGLIVTYLIVGVVGALIAMWAYRRRSSLPTAEA